MPLFWQIAKLLMGAASTATGMIGIWAIVSGDLAPLALVVAIPSLVCGLSTAYPHHHTTTPADTTS